MKKVIFTLATILLVSLTSCGKSDKMITYKDTTTGQEYKKESYWFHNNGAALREGMGVSRINNPDGNLVVVKIEEL